MEAYVITEKDWIKYLNEFLSEYQLYAPVKRDDTVDYEEIDADKIDEVYYEGNTPVTPLKAFFLPVKENVVDVKEPQPRVVIGVPNCDLAAVDLLDNIYLDEEYIDPCYKQNREMTVIFGKDCYQYKESCHCTAYNIKPYPEKNCDVSMSVLDGIVSLTPMSNKGKEFLEKFKISTKEHSEPEFRNEQQEKVSKKREEMVQRLQKQNIDLPDEIESRKIIENAKDDSWKKYSDDCVSCGACSFICPTCHCFLLIDKRSFEKVRNWDVCQYPGFARVAAGEDPLKSLSERFKFRYFCKYSYKPDMFNAIACTGCGRCTDTCIGKINKNEVILGI